jgi:hypothetical protein
MAFDRQCNTHSLRKALEVQCIEKGVAGFRDMLMHVSEQLNGPSVTQSRMREKAKTVLQLSERITGDEGLFELEVGVWNVGGGGEATSKVMHRQKYLLWKGPEDGDVAGTVLQSVVGSQKLCLRQLKPARRVMWPENG